MTSSIASIHEDGHVSKDVYTEKDFNKITKKTNGYVKSKILAEQAVWEFMENEKPDFTLVTLHPGLIVGPGVF